MQYFCLITSDQNDQNAYEVLKSRLDNLEWSLYKFTQNKEIIKENDELIFYIAGKRKMSQHFVAKATIDKMHKTLDENDKILEVKLKLKNIAFFDNPVLIDVIKNNLDFIKHKHNLGLNLQGGCKLLSKEDYDLILNYVNKNK